MSDSDLSSSPDNPKLKKQPKGHFEIDKKEPRKEKRRNLAVEVTAIQAASPMDEEGLQGENKKLRRKLKQLSARLDDELQRAAENKLKMQSIRNPTSTGESQNLEMQNAYKIIERLQKAVKEFEANQVYQVTLKRVTDLQNIIRKKELQTDDLRLELKTVRKSLKDKQKHIEQLLQNGKKPGNPTEDIEAMNRIKTKLKKVAAENDLLRKKELEKHEKLVLAQRKIVEMEQNQYQIPIGREEGLLKQLEEAKTRLKESMLRIERQNMYISKLNEKVDRARRSESESDRKKVSRSVQQLPQLHKNQLPLDILAHLPSPHVKLKRY